MVDDRYQWSTTGSTDADGRWSIDTDGRCPIPMTDTNDRRPIPIDKLTPVPIFDRRPIPMPMIERLIPMVDARYRWPMAITDAKRSLNWEWIFVHFGAPYLCGSVARTTLANQWDPSTGSMSIVDALGFQHWQVVWVEPGSEPYYEICILPTTRQLTRVIVCTKLDLSSSICRGHFQHNYYNPSQELSVDEAMVKCKGRAKGKVYMPNKPVKRGLKSGAARVCVVATYVPSRFTLEGQ